MTWESNYSFNSENQLVKVEHFTNNVKTKTIDYFYDAIGRRVRKNVENHQLNSTQVKDFTYDGSEMLAEYKDGSLLNVFTQSSLRTDDTLAADNRENSKTYVFVKDALGSVVDLRDSSDGSLVQHYSYSSFGKLLKISNGAGADITNTPLVDQGFAYTNREWDSDAGMYYYRARWYQPETGRFISVDPDPGKKLNPSTLNSKYIYSLNDPIGRTDPTGMFSLKNFVVGVAASLVGSWAGSALGGAIGTGTGGPAGTVIGVIFGAVAGAVVGAAAGYTVNGFINIHTGKDFSDGWREAVTIGAISGAIAGGTAAYKSISAIRKLRNSISGAYKDGNYLAETKLLIQENPITCGLKVLYSAGYYIFSGITDNWRPKYPDFEGVDDFGNPVHANQCSVGGGGGQCAYTCESVTYGG